MLLAVSLPVSVMGMSTSQLAIAINSTPVAELVQGLVAPRLSLKVSGTDVAPYIPQPVKSLAPTHTYEPTQIPRRRGRTCRSPDIVQHRVSAMHLLPRHSDFRTDTVDGY